MQKRSLPVHEVAERLGVSRQRVHNLLRIGRLKRSRRDSVPGRYYAKLAFYITLQSVEQFEADRQAWAERRQSRDQGGDE